LQVERIPLAPFNLLDTGKDSVECTETPIPESMWWTGQAMLGSVARTGARVLISGHWADQILYDPSYLVDLFRRFRWKQLGSHVREYPRWFTDEDALEFRRRVRKTIMRSFIPRFLVPWLRRARYRLKGFQRNRPWYTDTFRDAASLAPPPLHSAGSSSYARSLYDTVRSRFYVLAMASSDKVAAHHGIVRAYPFLDRDLIAFLMAIPGETATYHGVPKALLRDALRDVLPQSIAARNWKADTTRLEIDAMRNEYPRIADFLTRECVAARTGYVDATTLRDELSRGREQLNGSNLDVAWSMEYLVGLEMWLRTFFSGRNS